MKITGPTVEYRDALIDGADPLNGLITLLAAFDVKFTGNILSFEI